MIIAGYDNNRELNTVSACYDYVIVGGGMTGVCNAITAARQGVKVALVQDRPVLGGNASSEVRLWVLGATSHMGNNNRWSREGGVIDELLVENTCRNREGNPVLFDTVLMDKVLAEPNITLYLNTVVYDVEKADGRTISKVVGFNSMTATRHILSGKLFADCSGDGILAYLAGAAYRIGAEDPGEFGEGFAPDKEKYGEVLGHSILFYIKDTGKPVKYTAPGFALKNAEEHIPKLHNPKHFDVSQHGCKYWWLEYGGRLDTIGDTEKIKHELWKVVYGVWDYIKNSGKFPQMGTYTLEWVGLIPGKRESRRFAGHTMLTQKDIIEQRECYDAVAFGGWSIDLHPADGVYSPKNGCDQWHSKGIYAIPYRCYVPPGLDNLFLGGRIISTSHVANGSTRVMCTAAHGGQAIGMAAALCLENGLLPADYTDKGKIADLQQRLLATGHFLPSIEYGKRQDKIASASVTCSEPLKLEQLPEGGGSFRLDYPAAQLIPVGKRVPAMTVNLTASEETVLEVQLRSSSKPANYTPDRIDAVRKVVLKKGANEVKLDFEVAYPSPRYAFVCFMTNDKVSVPMSDLLVSGLTSVFNYVNPAVSNYGKQSPAEGMGIEEFEFWCPKRRPDGKNLAMKFSPALDGFGRENLLNGYFRPYLTPNGWIPAPGTEGRIEVEWPETQEISRIRLFFDTDFDHAMENVQMGHFDSVMPFCIREYSILDENGETLFRQRDNYQSCNEIVFEKPYRGKKLTVCPVSHGPEVMRALMGIIIE